MRNLVHISILSLLLPMVLYAQQDSLPHLSNWRAKTLVIKENTPFRLDSLTVLPQSLEVFDAHTGKKVEDYDFDYNRFTWKGTSLPDTLDLRYQVMLLDLERPYSRLDTQHIQVDPTAPPGFVYDPFAEDASRADIFNMEGLQYNGAFTRGLSFGNSQDLVLNSSFNLQMQGDLGNDITVLAAISDQNIPLQPEGNTQSLQDFDRVFIQLKRKRGILTAGDFDLRKPPGYFMNYNKKLQGAKLETTTDALGGEWSNSAAFAISGGKFARQNLAVTEGNQGPYKLRGNDNELFIIVLSGTERVFLDGEQLTRGEINDYVIDYNRGEVSFTTNRLITKDVRIIVEFEYTDQNYTRFLYTLGSAYQKGKWKARLNFYNEQDSKNPSGNQILSEEQIAFLAGAGDNFQDSLASGLERLEEFTTDRITYALVDTVVNGILYSNVLVYDTHPDRAEYTARFTELGQGNGNYILSGNAANGRVYEWVAPEPLTGTPQGNFEPVVKLTAPQKKQLLTLGGEYDLGEGGAIRLESAMSLNDLNRFSEVDARDDRGASLRADYRQTHHLGPADLVAEGSHTSDWQLTTEAGYEYKQRNFQALSPYRAAEFARDWDIDNTDKLDEHMATAGGKIKRNDWGELSYHAHLFLRDSSYTGIKQDWGTRLARKGFRFSSIGSYLNTETPTQQTRFLRPRGDVSYTFKPLGGLRIGLKGEQEKKQDQTRARDSLLASSFQFDILGGYFETSTPGNTQLGGSYRRRWDRAVDDNAFKLSTIADEVNLNGEWKPAATSQLRWNMTYRNLHITETELTTQEALETYLGRIEHNIKILKGLLYSNTQYEIGSGQEPEREFVYQKVNDGEGVYTWIDRNVDSIPQLDEFEVAVFQDQANYVRLATLTDRYIRTNQVLLNNALAIEPRAVWHQEKGNWKAAISKFSFQSNVRINRKVLTNDGSAGWNPFALSVPDTSLVTRAEAYRATLFFNRSHPKYDFRIGLNHNNGRNILTTGYENRSTKERFLASRWNISKAWRWTAQFSEGWREADSEFFNNKDYRIRWYRVVPELIFQPNPHFRLSQSYQYQNAQNRINEQERAIFHDLKTECVYNKVSKSSLRASFSFVQLNFDGEANTPVGYTMLEGKQNGNNYLWTISLDRQLSRNLLLSLSYDGRKTGDADVVHLGRASVRANF